MKKLGLIGGMGPESTIPYYHGIVYGVQKKLNKSFFPTLTIESVNVFQLLEFCKNQQYDEMVDYLMGAIMNLYKAGADFIAMSANTPHIVFDRLKEKSPVKLISIVEATSKEAIKKGYKKIGLLGTVFTMENDFFKTPFINNDIEIFIPDEEERNIINDKIYNEIELGIIKEETQELFLKIIKRLQTEKGIEAIILGCTELPLILNNENSPVPCLDTMKIHIEELVREIVD